MQIEIACGFSKSPGRHYIIDRFDKFKTFKISKIQRHILFILDSRSAACSCFIFTRTGS